MPQISKIKKLPDEAIDQIAAGEVIERPASVVKELVENSIDSGASAITVKVEDYGRKLIEVSDNGCGMTLSDIKQSIRRHATSKISGFDDIFSVKTLGFRGEALPSIASISKLEIASKMRNQIEGIRVSINNETTGESSPAGIPAGTIVSVRKLFYNTPVRKKFLKADRTEFSQISDTINKIALVHYNIEFNLFHDDKKIFSYKTTRNPSERILEISGRNFARNSSEILYEDKDFFLRGFIGAPTITRGNASGINVFVNGRYIKDKSINHAVINAYRTLLMSGRYPLAMISLNIDPSIVDINVHPTKSEVKFVNPGKIYDIVSAIVQKKLSSHFWIERDLYTEDNNLKNGISASAPHTPEGTLDNEKELLKERILRSTQRYSSSTYRANFSKLSTAPASAKNLTEKDLIFDRTGSDFFKSLRPIGQFRALYLICERDDVLYLIDHHAAHERVMFEKIKKDFESGEIASQSLLIPLVLDLDSTKTDILEKLTGPCLETGIEFEHFGDGSFVVKRVPAIIPEDSISNFLTELIDKVIESDFISGNDSTVKSTFISSLDKIFSVMACHSAIRGKKKLEGGEITSLLNNLDELDIRSNCPHGRPILIELTLNEIEKRFGRQI